MQLGGFDIEPARAGWLVREYDYGYIINEVYDTHQLQNLFFSRHIFFTEVVLS